MRLAKVVMAVAACSLAAPALAASSASKLSITGAAAERASTVIGESNEAVTGFLIPAIAVLVIVGGVLILSDDDSDSN
ncbi:hypothetical protein [Sphingomonas sp.]|uniref:hypothetical protein n=1 Tax=Sphingomonas sp. TaxID=28214 RepID=UPI002ED80604